MPLQESTGMPAMPGMLGSGWVSKDDLFGDEVHVARKPIFVPNLDELSYVQRQFYPQSS